MTYPQPSRVDVLAGLESLTRNFKHSFVVCLIEDFAEWLEEWKYGKEVEIKQNEYDKRYRQYLEELHTAEYLLAMGTNGTIDWPEEPAPFVPPMPVDHGGIDWPIPPMYGYALDVLSDREKQNTRKSQSLIRRFPLEIDTHEARKYFARAVKENMMEMTDAGGKWLMPQVWLGYLCYKIYEQPRPINDLETYFGVKKLSSSITQAALPAKRADVRGWRKDIDKKIFFD